MNTMTADRETDARVAQRVMGWREGEDFARATWSPTSRADHDVMVLEYIRETWPGSMRLAFTGRLLERWDARRASYPRHFLAGPPELPLLYEVGDYARAALRVVEEMEPKGEGE